jgi:hypothetical protein
MKRDEPATGQVGLIPPDRAAAVTRRANILFDRPVAFRPPSVHEPQRWFFSAGLPLDLGNTPFEGCRYDPRAGSVQRAVLIGVLSRAEGEERV